MTAYTSGDVEEARPAWWRWFRLREGRTIYRTTVTLAHKSNAELTVTIEGKDPVLVSKFANSLKNTIKAAK